MNRTVALKILGIEGTAVLSPSDIESAYKRALKAAHPDTGGDYPYTIKEIKEARVSLLYSGTPATTPCIVCKGTGRVVQGFRSQVCGTCHGTGVKP